MKVSIITVVYNNEKYIGNVIESVLAQGYSNIEYIIVDGQSKDGTLEIIKSYQNRIAKIISEPDKGIYDAMNKGIMLATGDVIGIINSDDLYVDDKVINCVMNEFIQDGELDILYGDLVYVQRENVDKIIRTWTSMLYYDNFFERGHVPPHPTLFLRKHVYNIAGLFDLHFSLAADYDFMLRIFKEYHFKSKYLKKIIIKMRLGGATNKSYKNIINGNKEILRSWKKYNLKVPILFMPRKIINRILQFL